MPLQGVAPAIPIPPTVSIGQQVRAESGVNFDWGFFYALLSGRQMSCLPDSADPCFRGPVLGH
jgi:hypothetical protein